MHLRLETSAHYVSLIAGEECVREKLRKRSALGLRELHWWKVVDSSQLQSLLPDLTLTLLALQWGVWYSLNTSVLKLWTVKTALLVLCTCPNSRTQVRHVSLFIHVQEPWECSGVIKASLLKQGPGCELCLQANISAFGIVAAVILQ